MKPTRYYSKKQESQVAKTLKGKVQSNSGATPFKKGDVVLDDWLLECKTKTSPSQSISVKREWIEKNNEEAFAMGKSHSAVVFNFGDTHYPENYYIISEDDFKNLVEMQKTIEDLDAKIYEKECEISELEDEVSELEFKLNEYEEE